LRLLSEKSGRNCASHDAGTHEAYCYFHENEKATSETLAKYTKLDFSTALETYRLSRFSFTANGILTDSDVETLLKRGARTLGLSQRRAGSEGLRFYRAKRGEQRTGIR
jgi:hypothetical protein